jgi:hypothetical protein
MKKKSLEERVKEWFPTLDIQFERRRYPGQTYTWICVEGDGMYDPVPKVTPSFEDIQFAVKCYAGRRGIDFVKLLGQKGIQEYLKLCRRREKDPKWDVETARQDYFRAMAAALGK